MSAPTCIACRWSSRDSEQHFLECRYNAPNQSTGPGWAEWPLVRPADWCGKWEKKDGTK